MILPPLQGFDPSLRFTLPMQQARAGLSYFAPSGRKQEPQRGGDKSARGEAPETRKWSPEP